MKKTGFVELDPVLGRPKCPPTPLSSTKKEEFHV
jgi:hypothetical protein